MSITLPPELETALAALAAQRGVAPEELALKILRRHVVPAEPLVPRDEWERKLFSIGIDCGVSVPDEALSSDGLYD